MSRIYFTADTHFGTDAIRRYENRPFEDVERMDSELIQRWNEVVTPEDTVWHLGDFGGDGSEAEILSQLNGIKYLVKGNHDTHSNDYYRKAGFTEVYDYPVLFQGFWLLSHEPLYINTNMPYANLFGHVHASPIVSDFSKQHFCVCVERTDYKPVDFEAVKQAMGFSVI